MIAPPMSANTIHEVVQYLREKGGLKLGPGTRIRCGKKKEKWSEIYDILEQQNQVDYNSVNPNFKIMLFANPEHIKN